VQFTVCYRDWHHQPVRRVVTRRLRATGSWESFVKSIDGKVAAAMMVKRLVADAQRGASPHDNEAAVDALARAVCARFGSERSGAGSEARLHSEPELPSHLAALPLLLYHLRRGPLLGPVVQSSDDCDALRSELLRSDRAATLRLAHPSLLGFSARGDLEELPLDSTVLLSERILFLDAHSQIMVWSGAAVSGPAFAAYRSACLARGAAAGRWRLPQPELMACREGSSAARWITARLQPAHKDGLDGPQSALPLSAEQRAELSAKLLPTDELSFQGWRRNLLQQ